jgi:hypothetical protein
MHAQIQTLGNPNLLLKMQYLKLVDKIGDLSSKH